MGETLILIFLIIVIVSSVTFFLWLSIWLLIRALKTAPVRKPARAIFLFIASQAIPFVSACLAAHFGRILLFLMASTSLTILVVMTVWTKKVQKIPVVHIATSIVPLSFTYFFYLLLLFNFDISRMKTLTLW